jgi:hypothetical protein
VKSLTIEAKSAESAVRLAGALEQFHPELSGSDLTGFRITVQLGSESHVVAVLDALEDYVTARSDGPAAVELDGKHYRVHPRQASELPKP